MCTIQAGLCALPGQVDRWTTESTEAVKAQPVRSGYAIFILENKECEVVDGWLRPR